MSWLKKKFSSKKNSIDAVILESSPERTTPWYYDAQTDIDGELLYKEFSILTGLCNIVFARFVLADRYLLFIDLDATTDLYRVILCKIISNNGKCDTSYKIEIQFSKTLTDMKIMLKALVISSSILIVIGFDRNNKLTVYQYQLNISNNVINCYLLNICFINGNDCTILSCQLTGCKSYKEFFAFSLSNPSKLPLTHHLYVFKFAPKLILYRSYKLNHLIQFPVSDICFIGNTLLIATEQLKLLQIDLHNDRNFELQREIELSDEVIFLENDFKRVLLNTLERRGGDLYIVVVFQESAVVTLIPQTLPHKEQHVTIDLKAKFGLQRITWVYVNQLNRLLYIKPFITSNNLFIYNFVTNTIKEIFISTSMIGSYQSCAKNTDLFVNWYGDEVYFVRMNIICGITLSISDVTLKNLCRLKILENFTRKQLLTSPLYLPNVLLRYIYGYE